MMRGLFGTVLSALAAGIVGIGLYFVKHEVKEQEAHLADLNRQIQTHQEAIHVLKAEWSFLNDPARLKQLSEKYLDMKVMGPAQVTTLQALAPTSDHSAVAAAPKPPAARPATPSVAETRPPSAGGMR